MIIIDGRYVIDTDPLNFILKEKKTKQNGKHIGEEYYSVVGYFSTLQDAFEGYIELCLTNDMIDKKEKETEIRDVIDAVNESHNRAVASVKACCGQYSIFPDKFIG